MKRYILFLGPMLALATHAQRAPQAAFSLQDGTINACCPVGWYPHWVNSRQAVCKRKPQNGNAYAKALALKIKSTPKGWVSYEEPKPETFTSGWEFQKPAPEAPTSTDSLITFMTISAPEPEALLKEPTMVDGYRVYSLSVKPDWKCGASTNSIYGTSPTVITLTCVKSEAAPESRAK